MFLTEVRGRAFVKHRLGNSKWDTSSGFRDKLAKRLKVRADKSKLRGMALVRGDVFAETSAKLVPDAAKILSSFAALGLYTQARPCHYEYTYSSLHSSTCLSAEHLEDAQVELGMEFVY